MIKLTSTIVLALLIAGVSCSGNNTTVADLPPNIIEDIIAIFTKTSLNFTSNCLNATIEDVSLLLFNRTYNDTPIAVNISNPTEIDTSKKIILIVHGWWAGPESNGLPDLIQGYLERGDYNVLALNWTLFSYQSYGLTVCTVPGVAEIMAEFLCHMNVSLNVSLEEVHLLGHSIGAQMVGFIGASVNASCNASIGRITGLDPAGPGYQGLPISLRLDASDAIFVDIIHTNQGEYGYVGDCGDADFYVNCALLQPGCLLYDITHILNTTLEVLNCSHMRSIDYYAESVNSDKFLSRACIGCPLICLPKPFTPKNITMGEDCSSSTEGGYLLSTNAFSPYAQG